MKRKVLLGSVFLALLAFNSWVIASYGYIGFLEAAHSSLAGIQVLVDLTIALTLVLLWIVRDARERGISWVPYAIATVFLGSVGPLAYLLRRESRSVEAPAAGVRAPLGGVR
jgi:hypothetical protein